MDADLPFPQPDPAREVPRRDFAPFDGLGSNDAIGHVLDTISVGGVTAVWYQARPGWKLAQRRIADDMFLHIAEGELEIVVESRPSLLRCGQAAHFHRGVVHEAAAPNGRPFKAVSLHYTAKIFDSLTVPQLLDFPEVFDFREDPVAIALLTDACRTFLHRPAGYHRILEATITRFLVHCIDGHLGDWRSMLATSRLSQLARLMPAIDAMRHDLAHPVSMAQLAGRCHLSPSQFRRVFRNVMNELPIDYLRRIRMERACQLLRSTSMSIADVAAAVGYEETAFFARSFRRLLGTPPGRYRQQAAL